LTTTATSLKLSSILSGLSYALDLTEGHPRGHASRSCLIGMRMAAVLGLSPDDRSHLFYALLLKDAGCSSNSARVFQLFGELAFDASAHHERLDGRGYYRNLPAAQLSKAARILAAADQLDALSAERPYRGKLPRERVISIMKEEAGTGLCPECVVAAVTVLERMPGDPLPQQ